MCVLNDLLGQVNLSNNSSVILGPVLGMFFVVCPVLKFSNRQDRPLSTNELIVIKKI